MYRAYKFRLDPNQEQQQYFAGAFGCARWFWNYNLNLSQETYKATGKGLSRGAIQGWLPSLKKEYPWLKKGACSQSLQVVALNLSFAYQSLFEKKARFPSFKSKRGRQSVSYPHNVKVGEKSISLPVIGEIACKIHRAFDGTVKTVTISKNPDGKYDTSISVDRVSNHCLAKAISDEALQFLALGTSAAASGGNVNRGGKISVLSDAVPIDAGSLTLGSECVARTNKVGEFTFSFLAKHPKKLLASMCAGEGCIRDLVSSFSNLSRRTCRRHLQRFIRCQLCGVASRWQSR